MGVQREQIEAWLAAMPQHGLAAKIRISLSRLDEPAANFACLAQGIKVRSKGVELIAIFRDGL